MQKIAFDFDGVIADTDKIKKEWFDEHKIFINKFNKSDIFESLKKIYSHEYILQIYNEMSNYVFNSRNMKRIIPVQDSVKSLYKLSKQFEIIIISARNLNQIILLNEWLQKYQIHSYITKIISSSEEKKDKLQICEEQNIVLLCDDDIRHLKSNKDYKIKKILFNSSTNTNSEIIHIYSWDELVEYIGATYGK